MAQDHRINSDSGRVPFSCENRRYRTNIRKGESHSPLSQTRGSVFATPLIQHDRYSLRLEHVEEVETGVELYWLMWYSSEGIPTIPLSGVFDRTELSGMLGHLVGFVP